MIKLADEQISDAIERVEQALGMSSAGWDLISATEIFRAIEAEVLRLNGITDKCDGNHAGARCADPECWNDAPGERVYNSVDELFDALGINDAPRATGCPETMDDTGHFAEVDMPAFLRRQAG